MDREQVIALQHQRFATKKYDPNRRISQKDWEALVEVGRLAPSSIGLEPWKMLLLKNERMKEDVKHPNAKAIGLPRLMLPIGKVWFSLCVPNHRDFTEFELQRIPYRSHTSYLQRRNFAHFLR